MKKILMSCLAIMMVASMLSACTQAERKNTGMAAGAVVGGVAGSALTGGSTAGTIAGAVGGAFVGRAVTD